MKGAAMKYRVEFKMVGVENGNFGKKEFDAETDEVASSRAVEICQETQTSINNSRPHRFWPYTVVPTQLVRIDQPEISNRVEISEQAQVE